MQLNCNPNFGAHLARKTQQVRIISESWFALEGYCLNCSSPRLERTPANTIFRDFQCPRCGQGYELKSSARQHRGTVRDGGYDAMMRKIAAKQAPVLLLMQYNLAWRVHSLAAVHPVFLTTAVVKKRPKPHLRPGTGKPYWMCDLDLTVVPPDGKVVLVDCAATRPLMQVRKEFALSKRLETVPLKERGWTSLVLSAVRGIGKQRFALSDVYAYEATMKAAYPENDNVRPKIRQQLQVLRDLKYIEFGDKRGEYKIIDSAA
jgi:type II restriction enzyme